MGKHFNPLPPHGGRLGKHPFHLTSIGFQSTPSAWRETKLDKQWYIDLAFQSTPSAWRETATGAALGRMLWISIHSLRMEGDFFGGDIVHSIPEFQSTPSAWRETNPSLRHFRRLGNFNPLPPHGGRHQIFRVKHDLIPISIHSLRMEGDG